ncbi:hypothetical protein ABL78_7189 [Leptomonas seymouri]|uniref:Uncharacterized protein n=1 Tax=Leptomonas seymouri TaxID=5684 RepID=A0A0N1I101_LEPSE|nr:hypothetical protein ABL78_7189 [Leptomonas seymouri]|eukprot:KPI83773.1 hypothetical protein ABL78_7189 [Leptomonas seymouri]
MSSSHPPVAGRKPIRLPQLASPLASAPAGRRSSLNTHRGDRLADMTSGANNNNFAGGNTWAGRLHDFVRRHTWMPTTAALTKTRSFGDGVRATRAPMRSHASATSEGSAAVRCAPLEDDAVTSTFTPPFAQRVVALTEDIAAAETRIDADEEYFSDVAEVELCVMEHLREWRGYANTDGGSGDGNEGIADVRGGGSLRGPGVYGERDGEATRISGTYFASNSDISTTTPGAGGSLRVQTDLESVRQCIIVMEELHNALTTLEDEHRELQRHYIVEKTSTAELDLLCERLEELEREERGLPAAAPVADAPLKRQRRPQRGAASAAVGHEKGEASQREREAVQAGLSACHELTDQLRTRVAAVAGRLTDELLGMRAEVDRHDWSTLRAATSLTRMEPVAAVCERDVRAAVTSASSGFNFDDKTEDVRSCNAGRACATAGDEEEGYASGLSSGGSSPSSSIASSAFSHSAGRDGSGRRDSLLLRVRVPIFIVSTAPPLPTSDAFARLSGGSRDSSSNINSGCPSRGSVGGRATSAAGARLSAAAAAGGLGRSSNMRRLSSSSAASTAASPATIAVVATPARFALMQLYEACRDFLAQMMLRLTQLRARRGAEAEELQRERDTLDAYDPAADDVSARLQSVQRYIALLDGHVEEVSTVHQDLHDRVKRPMDASLQTYERFRAQLLELLTQRLELEEGKAEPAAAARRASQEGRESRGEGDGHQQDAKKHHTLVKLDVAGAETRNHQNEEAPSTDNNNQRDHEGEQEQQLHHPTASLSQERARRSTKSPQPVSTPPTERGLPRASAEFIGMLDTILENQQKASEERQHQEYRLAAEEKILSTPPPTADTPADVIVIRMTGHPAAPPTTSRAEGVEPPGETASDVSPVPMRDSSQRLAGHRRPRGEDDAVESSKDREGGRIGKVQATRGDASVPERSRAAAEEEHAGPTTLAVSSTASDSAEDALGDDNLENESLDSSGDDDDAPHHAESPLGSRQAARKRYGLRDMDGFSGGLQAFFSAVARRVMDFGDSDEEEGDEMDAATERQRKRLRLW